MVATKYMTVIEKCNSDFVKGIIDNLEEIKNTKGLVGEIVEGNDKNFKGQVANCFVTANGNREAIERCKELQHLE